MNITYLIIEIENGRGNIIYQVYSLEEAKKSIHALESNHSWRGVDTRKHIYVPFNVSSISLSTPTALKEL